MRTLLVWWLIFYPLRINGHGMIITALFHWQTLTMEVENLKQDCDTAAVRPGDRLQVTWTLTTASAIPQADASYTIDTSDLLPLSLHVTQDPHILYVPALHVRETFLSHLMAFAMLASCHGCTAG